MRTIQSTSDVLRQPVTALSGVGPRMAERLERLGIRSVQDLLFHLPLRYEDRTHLSAIGALRAGDSGLVVAEVLASQVKFGRRRSLLVRIGDGTGQLTLRFFHFSRQQQEGFQRGQRIRCFGEIRRGSETLEIVHPEYRLLQDDEEAALEQSLTPFYPATEGLQQTSLRRLTDQALALMEQNAHDLELLPDTLIRQLGFPPLPEALRQLHRPAAGVSLQSLQGEHHPARRRLAFEELLGHHLSLRKLRQQAQRHAAPPLPRHDRLLSQYFDNLGFELTGAQQRVIDEISVDLARNHPMLRLVQGDVGSGKTAVAAAAALIAMENNWQVAVMAPTELLAEQHLQNFSRWLEPLGVEVAWLSGRQGVKQRREQLTLVREGIAGLVIGTHALFQEDVEFARLGLVIIDEQHRFGVHQRLALRNKGGDADTVAHQLIMTATPIPRTLAMAAYADLDVSIIDELPKGRQPVDTVVLPDSRRPQVIERVRAACAEGRQVYWVCPLVEESELLDAQAAEQTTEELRQALPELRIGLIHGRMKGQDKEQIMSAFKAGELQLLVATTVIEVGVDVPNASLMIMENAERLGLAQLHQLRGRVGRGSVKSACVLMYHGRLSQVGRARLAAMRDSNDGFVIAQRDLELRGPGELLGTRQTGELQFRIADLQKDAELMPLVEKHAQILCQQPDTMERLIRRWLPQGLHYGEV